LAVFDYSDTDIQINYTDNLRMKYGYQNNIRITSVF